ncbi:MAG: hypothetical protein LBJ31_11880 [Treponema sp.]|jgi:hypothetical protein|nr:hypothetical protein [Treponema sp.]
MNYETDFFQRPVVMNNAPIAAGTYKRGQLLGVVDATGIYGAYSSSAVNGLQIVRAVCVNDATLAAAGTAAIAKGEFQKEGVIAANAAVTAAMIAQCFDHGIILN